jgi:hypothetical protein
VAHESGPDLLVLHALRLKGFAEPADVADATNLAEAEAADRLGAFRDRALVKRRDGRVSGFLLAPTGRELHARLLDEDVAAANCRPLVESCYQTFLAHNETFKQLCGDWQLRTIAGAEVANDHRDAGYDATIVERLTALQPGVARVIDELATAMARFAPYARRLARAADRFAAGEHAALTQPLTRSYHDVWMELHEDFLVTLARDRSASDGY